MVKPLKKTKQKPVSSSKRRNRNQSVVNLNAYRDSHTSVSLIDSPPLKNKIKAVPNNSPTKKTSFLSVFFLYLLRLIILSVGIGAIAGTALHLVSQQRLLSNAATNEVAEKIKENPLEKHYKNPLVLTQEVTTLKKEIEQLTAKTPQLKSQVFFFDLDTGNYIDINSSVAIAAASTIKIPILVAFFQDVDAGKIRLDEMLTMTEELKAGGSGAMQYKGIGTKFTALETAAEMIINSDNSATNMIINRLGGINNVNQRFREWGLENTLIKNYLPDLEGTNTTSSKDLAYVLGLVNDGQLVSVRARDRILGIMQKTKTRTLLPQGLGAGAIIAHKTGDIGTILGDAGIVDMPNGKRYLVATLVQRPHNDYSARTLIQNISKAIYNYSHQKPFVSSN